jgi:hypothetical protein
VENRCIVEEEERKKKLHLPTCRELELMKHTINLL